MARATFVIEVTCDIGTLDPQELMGHVEAAIRDAEGPAWTELVEVIGGDDEWAAVVECTDAWSLDEDGDDPLTATDPSGFDTRAEARGER